MSSSVKYDKSSHVFQSEVRNGVYNPYTDTLVYDGGLIVDELKDNEEIIIYDGGDIGDEFDTHREDDKEVDVDE